MDILNKINYLLEKNNLKQKDLTDYLGIEKSVFSSWKNGKSKSYSKYLTQIAQFFNVSLETITGDSVEFNIDLKGNDFIICPICSSDMVNFVKTISVDFSDEKSSGFAAQFICDEGHIFYQIFESFKGYTYTAFTNESTVLKRIKINDIYYESAPYNLADAIRTDNLLEKYVALDEYGKEAVESIISVEYKRFINQQNDGESNLINLRFYEYTAVSAGTGLYDDNNEFPTVKQVPNNAITRAADFCCYVNGDSMEPEFFDGDLVCVKEQPSVEIGEIGIFVISNELFIKKMSANGLVSLNPEYDIIKKSPDIICQGKVLGKI